VPNDSARDIPDVAFAASPDSNGYLICGDGWCTNGFRNSTNDLDVLGGTSASAPSFAGLLALVMQKGGGNRLGNINTNLYSLAQFSTNAFHDITSGNNTQACQSGTTDCTNVLAIGYYAGTGYDQTTGLGSLDGYNFAEQWFGDFTLSPSVSALTVQPGSSATATVSVVPQNNFSGPVTFTCSVAGGLIDVTCSVPGTAVSGAGGSAIVTITAAITAKTPWWRRHLTPPPLNRNWMLVAAAMLIVMAGLYWSRKDRSVYHSSLYAFSLISLVAIAGGAVSCGGTSGSTGVASSPAPLTLTCNLANAMAGMAYSGSCSASGGTAPYTYSIVTGALPAGLTLDATTGVISGTATVLAEYSLSFKVTDSENPPQYVNLLPQDIAVVAPTLTLSCQLPPAVTGVAYSGACTGIGGITPLRYQTVAGALPLGLILNATTGAITGTPVSPGTTSFVVQVADSSPIWQSATYSENSFVVTAGQLAISCALPSGKTGVYYSGTCSSSGGTPPVTYSISAGNLPTGLTLIPTGVINGSPVTSGTNSFTVKATDTGSPVQVSQLNESLVIATGPLNVDCGFSGLKVSLPVSASACNAFGGNPPFKYSIISGALPAGITLNSSTGMLTGVPTTAGTSSFTVQTTDSSSPIQNVTQPYNAVVSPTAPLALNCAAQQQPGNLGFFYFGLCSFTGGNDRYTASVISGTLPPGLTISVYDPQVQLYGIPTAMGTSTVTIQLTDGSVPAKTTTAQTTITIGPRRPETDLVTITATSGGITSTTTITVTVP
jgi:hypothetical protein